MRRLSASRTKPPSTWNAPLMSRMGSLPPTTAWLPTERCGPTSVSQEKRLKTAVAMPPEAGSRSRASGCSPPFPITASRPGPDSAAAMKAWPSFSKIDVTVCSNPARGANVLRLTCCESTASTPRNSFEAATSEGSMGRVESVSLCVETREPSRAVTQSGWLAT